MQGYQPVNSIKICIQDSPYKKKKLKFFFLSGLLGNNEAE